MIITNKIESINMIKELDLNRFAEDLFKCGETNRVIEFIKENPADFYAIRDKEKSGGVFKLAVSRDDVLDEIKDYKLFTINVSSVNYADNQLLVGEIEFLSDNSVYLCATDVPGASVRDALRCPKFNLKTDIFDKKLDDIPYFDTIYKYVVDHELFDVIVEFAVFDINVGIKNENIIIYELRTNY